MLTLSSETFPYLELEVDLHVAALIFLGLCANLLLDFFAVQVLLNAAQNLIAQVATLALLANIVRVHACVLIRHNLIAVTFHGSRQAHEDVLGVIAVLDEVRTRRVGGFHLVTLRAVEDGAIAIVTGHLGIVLVLNQRIGQTVTNQQTLEVDGSQGRSIVVELGNVVLALIVTVQDSTDGGNVMASI